MFVSSFSGILSAGGMDANGAPTSLPPLRVPPAELAISAITFQPIRLITNPKAKLEDPVITSSEDSPEVGASDGAVRCIVQWSVSEIECLRPKLNNQIVAKGLRAINSQIVIEITGSSDVGLIPAVISKAERGRDLERRCIEPGIEGAGRCGKPTAVRLVGIGSKAGYIRLVRRRDTDRISTLHPKYPIELPASEYPCCWSSRHVALFSPKRKIQHVGYGNYLWCVIISQCPRRP